MAIPSWRFVTAKTEAFNPCCRKLEQPSDFPLWKALTAWLSPTLLTTENICNWTSTDCYVMAAECTKSNQMIVTRTMFLRFCNLVSWQITKGLLQKFGPERMLDTPITEVSHMYICRHNFFNSIVCTTKILINQCCMCCLQFAMSIFFPYLQNHSIWKANFTISHSQAILSQWVAIGDSNPPTPFPSFLMLYPCGLL